MRRYTTPRVSILTIGSRDFRLRQVVNDLSGFPLSDELSPVRAKLTRVCVHA